MSVPKTIGLPRMMKEPGEKRVFLPEFAQYLTRLGLEVFIEEGYGSRSGFNFSDYSQANASVHMCSRPEAFRQDIVLILRSPKPEEFEMLCPGCTLISMLHYPTRPKRVERLRRLDIKSISLDSIANGYGIRLVENMKAVAWNGLETAFDVLEKCWPGLKTPTGKPIKVLILGTGMVGKYAVDAATKLGNIERNNQHIQEDGPGAIAVCVGRNITHHSQVMEELFRDADILVDATQRRDTSIPIVPNEWLAWLPEHAVVTDLAVDPYLLDMKPVVVRGIDGIPQGSLDKYIFHPNDPEWNENLPESIPSQNRRTTVTCYSWPGIHPESCMRHYAAQLEPLMEVIAAKGYDKLSMSGGYFERALYRATIKAWTQSAHYIARPR